MTQRFETRDLVGGLALAPAATGTSGKTRLAGYAAVFYRAGTPGTEYQLGPGTRERIDPKAFDRALREDDIIAAFNHDWNMLLGRKSAGTLRMTVDSVGLRYEIDVDAENPMHTHVFRSVKRGDLRGSSFAFRVEDELWSRDYKTDHKIRTLKSVTLRDVGPVAFPAYDATSVSIPRALSAVEDAWRWRLRLAQAELNT